MPVNTLSLQYSQAVELATQVRDCVQGAYRIKRKALTYIPPPNRGDLNFSDPVLRKLAEQRYVDYVKYAIFPYFTSTTHRSYQGALFRKEPTLEIPEQLEYVKTSIDGGMSGIADFAKHTTSEVMQTGLFGILVDYPSVPEGATLAQQRALNLRARAVAYPVESIINWRTEGQSGLELLTLVVLREIVKQQQAGDEFEQEDVTQYRVLRLRNGQYTQQLYGDAGTPMEDERVILANGRSLPVIPFFPVGAEQNRVNYQKPTLYDISTLDLGYVRNSAAYEESLALTANPTLFLTSDMDATQWDAAHKDGIYLGSRRAYFLGANGKAELLTMQASTAAVEAMQNKIELAERMGARIAANDTSSNETAEAARIKNAGQMAALDTIASNTSSAITMALITMAVFNGAPADNIEFAINREFNPVTVSPQEITVLSELVTSGLLPAPVLYSRLRQSGIVPAEMSDAEIEQYLGDQIGEEMSQNPLDTETGLI